MVKYQRRACQNVVRCVRYGTTTPIFILYRTRRRRPAARVTARAGPRGLLGAAGACGVAHCVDERDRRTIIVQRLTFTTCTSLTLYFPHTLMTDPSFLGSERKERTSPEDRGSFHYVKKFLTRDTSLELVRSGSCRKLERTSIESIVQFNRT